MVESHVAAIASSLIPLQPAIQRYIRWYRKRRYSQALPTLTSPHAPPNSGVTTDDRDKRCPENGTGDNVAGRRDELGDLEGAIQMRGATGTPDYFHAMIGSGLSDAGTPLGGYTGEQWELDFRRDAARMEQGRMGEPDSHESSVESAEVDKATAKHREHTSLDNRA